MKHPAVFAIALAVGVAATGALAACGGSSGSDAATTARCYELTEGSSRAVIKVEAAPSANDPEGGQVTVYSYVDGVEEFAPETTAGRLEAEAFVYGDGTRLALTDASLTWPQDSMLEGAVFTSTSCP
jgi:hypothetical protein